MQVLWVAYGEDVNPLAPFVRQEPCWCGSSKTYRLCHKKWSQAQSPPGAPVPADNAEVIYLSPSVSMSKSLLPNLMPSGAPLTLPSETLTPEPPRLSGIEHSLADFDTEAAPLSPEDVGLHRVFLLDRLSHLPETEDQVPPEIVEGIIRTSLLAWQTAQSLALSQPRPSVLWNEEFDPLAFISKTILLSDYVLSPDKLVELVLKGATTHEVATLARSELRLRPLTETGHILMIPSGLGRFLSSGILQEMTRVDLENKALIDFVENQLVVEGPTAREVLFVRAVDDVQVNPHIWFYGRIQTDSVDQEDRTFNTRLLGEYESQHDYDPWIEQVKRQAIVKYIQRTTERLAVSELVGAEYVATSPFEARLLRHRAPSSVAGAASASVWADVPALSDLRSKDLARILKNDEAVEDLRSRVRLAIGSASDFSEQVQAVQELTAEIEHATQKLERKMRTERAYSAVVPALTGGAGILIGATTGLPGVAAGLLGTLGAVAPYVGAWKENRREAPYVFLSARRNKLRRK